MINKTYLNIISKQIDIQGWQVKNTIDLFTQGATVPFISRYRKEKTGSLDEVKIQDIKDLYSKFIELENAKNQF